MHSGKFSRPFLVFTSLALVAISVPSFGEDGPKGRDVKGPVNIAYRILELREQKAALELKIEEIKADESNSKELREAKIEAIQEKLRPIDSEIRLQVRRNKGAAKKFTKIERNEENSENLKAEIIDLIGEMDGKSPDEIKEIQKKIQAKREEMTRLENRVGRKEKAYTRKTGIDAPVRCKEGELRDPETNTCLPPIPVEPVVVRPSNEALKKFPECWTRDEKPFAAKLSTTFPLGEDELVRKGDPVAPRADQIQVSEAFDKSVSDFVAKLPNASSVRYYKIVASSHASRVPMKNRSTTESIANSRSEGAEKAFFTSLALNHNQPSPPLSSDYAIEKVDFSNENPVEYGPKWPPANLAKMKQQPTDLEIHAAADKMASGAAPYGNDPSPVIVPGDRVKTFLNLKQCCSKNGYALLYQPYQYSELTVYGETFTPDAEACARAWSQVSTNAGEKALPSQPTDVPNAESGASTDTSGSAN
jgi:hypothetical protein